MKRRDQPCVFCTKLFAVQKDGRPQINDEWPASIKGMLESSFDKDIALRPKASLFYDNIRDELKKIRNGNTRGLSDMWLQRRRTQMSTRNLFDSDEELTRLRSSSRRGKEHVEVVDDGEVDESFHFIEDYS